MRRLLLALALTITVSSGLAACGTGLCVDPQGNGGVCVPQK